jgi:hypothetical protein
MIYIYRFPYLCCVCAVIGADTQDCCEPERGRERERETDRQTDRQPDRQTDRERERQRERERLVHVRTWLDARMLHDDLCGP